MNASFFEKALVLLACCLIFCTAQASSTDSVWLAANQLYANKQYQEALQNYTELYSHSAPSAGLLHNMGLAYLQLNQLSDAVLSFERGLLFAPNDLAIKQSLAVAQARVETKLDQPRGIAVFQLLNRQAHMLQDRHYAWIAAFFSWFSVFCFFYFKKAPNRQFRLLAFWGASAGFFLMILSFSMAVHRNNEQYKTQYAIITALSSPLKSSPDTNSDNLIKLSEGIKVSILDQVGDWRRVKLQNGEQGWVSASDLELIEIFKS